MYVRVVAFCFCLDYRYCGSVCVCFAMEETVVCAGEVREINLFRFFSSFLFFLNIYIYIYILLVDGWVD